MSEKQKRLSISQKCSIVAELEKGTSQAEASRNFGVSKPAIKYIWDNREKFKGAVDSGLPNKRSNMKGPEKCKGLDSPLLEWFSNLRAAGKEVTGNMLLINAKNMATRLGFDTDTVNESWLQRLRERHGIHFKTIYGEANDCPDFEKWLEVMLPTFDEYEPSHILNADETALFYRMTGGKSFVLANEKNVRGRKQSKARATILTCVTMAGNRLPLTCISTAKSPRWPVVCGKRANAPIKYLSSKKGWMNTALFDDFVKDLHKDAIHKKQSWLLLVDNCPAHIHAAGVYSTKPLFGVRVVLLPKNTTSRLQPCDQGVIRSLKARYRKRLVRLAVHKSAEKVSLYESLTMLRASWNDVSVETVRNCWRKAGILTDTADTHDENEDSLPTDDTSADILAMEDVEYKEAVAAQPVVDFEEFMREIEGVCSEEEDIKGESESETEDNEPLPSTSECVAMLKQLKRRFIFSTGYVPDSVIETEEALLKLPLKQANITDFFKQP